MVGARHTPAGVENLELERFGKGILALLAVKEREVVHYGQRVGVALAQ